MATDQPAGSSLYWSINGANFNSDDLSSGVLEGSQLLDSTGNFSINLNLAADLNTEVRRNRAKALQRPRAAQPGGHIGIDNHQRHLDSPDPNVQRRHLKEHHR